MSLRLYSDDQENSIYIRREADLWRRSGLMTDEQHRAVYDLSDPFVCRTNLFFRILFFLFTLLGVGALTGLIGWLLEGHTGEMLLSGIIFFGGIASLVAAGYLVKKNRFYRHGIEEGLAVAGMLLCVAGFLIWADFVRWSGRIVPMTGWGMLAVAALLIYLRFGYLYAAVISLAALCAVPLQLPLSPVAGRLILLGILCAVLGGRLYLDYGLVPDFKKDRNTLFLTCLLAAIYLTVNLHIFGTIGKFSAATGGGYFFPEFYPESLYWISYVLTFAMPAAVIYGGIRSRRRLILNVGLVMALASLATHKSYLGLMRYPWDPVILGVLMIGLSLFLTRWLNAGANRQRSGFTACEILKPEDHGITVADAAAALMPAAADAGRPQSLPPESYQNGGASGGGGAQRNI